mgnify:CR=1 FL=1
MDRCALISRKTGKCVVSNEGFLERGVYEVLICWSADKKPPLSIEFLAFSTFLLTLILY